MGAAVVANNLIRANTCQWWKTDITSVDGHVISCRTQGLDGCPKPPLWNGLWDGSGGRWPSWESICLARRFADALTSPCWRISWEDFGPVANAHGLIRRRGRAI